MLHIEEIWRKREFPLRYPQVPVEVPSSTAVPPFEILLKSKRTEGANDLICVIPCHLLCYTELGDLKRYVMKVFNVYASISFVSQKSSEL